MKIFFQNQSKYARSFVDQAGGQLPLAMGGHSTVELSLKQFLDYARQFEKVCKIQRETDGMGRLLIVPNPDRPDEVQQATAQQLIDGARSGVFGEAGKLLVAEFDEREAVLKAG